MNSVRLNWPQAAAVMWLFNGSILAVHSFNFE